MAEIKIEKKAPVWPWILLVVLILAVLYFALSGDDDTDNTNNTEMIIEDSLSDENQPMIADDSSDVDAYLEYIADESKMGKDHNYTNNAILYLIEAVREKAEDLDVNIDADISKAESAANKITRDPNAGNHAENIKTAGSSITNAFEDLQQAKFPELSNDIKEQITAVNKIDPKVLTLEQKENIKTFFDESADLLRKMDNQ